MKFISQIFTISKSLSIDYIIKNYLWIFKNSEKFLDGGRLETKEREVKVSLEKIQTRNKERSRNGERLPHQ